MANANLVAAKKMAQLLNSGSIHPGMFVYHFLAVAEPNDIATLLDIVESMVGSVASDFENSQIHSWQMLNLESPVKHLYESILEWKSGQIPG